MLRPVLSLALVSCVALWAVSARADDAAPVTQADLKKLMDKLERLEQQVESLGATTPPAAPAASPSAIPAPPPFSAAAGVSSGSPIDLGASPSGSAAQVASLERRVKVLEDRYYDQALLNTQMQQWVSDVGGPALQAKGDNPAAASAPKSGELRIRNQMSSEQRVVVNGIDVFSVAPNTTRVIKVAVGTATTQITGEAPVSWFIGPQNYNQDIIIAPARNPLGGGSRMMFDPYNQRWIVVNE